MIKSISVVVFGVVFSFCLQAQTITMTRKGAPTGGNIVDIEVHPSGTVYTVVGNNGLHRSTDGGNTWTKVTVSSSASLNNALFDIEIDPAGAIYTVTNFSSSSAAMFVSTDNGVTWAQRTGSNPFGDFNYSPRLIERSGTLTNSPIFIVTGFNPSLARQSVFRSVDNGTSWTEVYSEASSFNEITAITSSGSTVVLLVNNKGVVRSSTGLAGSFSVSNSGFAVLGSTFFNRGAIALAGSPARLFINAAASGILESADLGVTWSAVFTPSLPSNFSIGGGSQVQLSGYGSTLQVYNNAGSTPQLFTLTVPGAGAVTWSNAASTANRSVFTRFYARSATEFYLGESSGISRSNNGTVWSASNSGIEAVQFLNSYTNAQPLRPSATGFVTGTNPQFTVGTDGVTWTRTGATGLFGTPRGFVQLPSGNWLAIADQTSISTNLTNLYVSTDQGATWTPRALAVGESFLNNITSNGTNIYATTTNRIFSSADEGLTWQQLSVTGLPGTFTFNSPNLSFFVMNNTLHMGGFDGVVRYYRIDLSTLAATLIPQPPLAVSLESGGLRGFGGKLYVASRNSSIGQLSVSSNNGVSWSTTSVPGLSFPTAFLTSTGYPAYAVTTGLVAFTRDEGQNWLTANLGFTAGESFTIRSVETDAAGLLNVLVDSKGLYQSSAAVVIPANPTNLQVLGSTFNQVRLEWDDNATNESYYRVERSVANNTSYDSIGFISASNLSAVNVFYNVEPSTAYFYRVMAVNAAGRSAYSNEVSITTPAKCATTVPDNRSWALTTLNESGLGTQTRANVNLQLSRLDNFLFSLSSLGGNTPGWASPNTALNTTFFTVIENCGSIYLFNSGNYTMNGNGTWNAATGKLTIKWKVNRGVTSSITPFSETTELTLNATDPLPAINTQQPYLSVLDDNGVMVSWTANPQFAQQIAVERATLAGGPWTEVGRVNHPESNFADRTGGLSFGNTYFYRLNAYNLTGNTAGTTNNSVLFRKPYFAAIEAIPFYPVASKLYTSWVDIDNDGRDELFYGVSSNVDRAGFISNIGLPTVALSGFGDSNQKIYRNARFADMNNDGNIDLVCNTQDLRNGSGSSAALEIYHGNGAGGFTLALRRAPSGTSFSDIALYDFDQDGRLDILVESSVVTSVAPFTQTFRLSILQNLGGGSFSPGTDLYTNDSGSVIDIALADYDNDGDTDIFLAGLFGAVNHRIFRNNGNNTFVQTPIATFEINPGIGMQSAAWGDIDNDGDLDLLCGYTASPATKALFRNDGGGTFTNLTASAVAEPFLAFSGSGIFLDVENDGDLDIVVNQQINSPTVANAILYLNNGSGVYTRRAGDGEFLNQSFPIKNQFTAGDFNNDGYLDLALGSSDRYRYILQNNKFTTGNWLKVKLRGVASNRSGIGARIQVTVGSRILIRDVLTQAGGSFNGQHSLTQHFGLATEAGPLTVRVTWPNNRLQTVTNVSVNQTIEIIEDTDGPTLTFSPANAATDVSAATKLDITVSETASAVAGKSVSLFLASSTTTPVASLPVTGATVTGNVFSFTLPSRLTQGAQYVVSVEEGAFVDAFGNQSASVPTTAWQFTVGTGPVLSSVNPANAATNVAVGTNIEINFDRAITAVAGKRIRVMDGATMVANVEVTAGTISGNRFTLDPATDLPFERTLQVLLDAGAFVDAKQNEFAGFAAGQYSFTTLQAPDVTAPTIVFDTTPLASLEKGFSPVTISATVTDNRAVAKVTLFYRRSGAASPAFQALALTNTANTNTWTGQIQNSFADDLGFEYFLEAEDTAPTPNQGRLPAQANQVFVARITFGGSNRPVVGVPGGGTKQSWRIISIPHELATTQISEVFTELGQSSKSTWRMLQYTANTNVTPVVESWSEFPAFSTIQRGRGYFINAFEGKEIVLNNAKSPDFSRSKLFELNLVKGWNLIGNPYTVQLLWDDIRTFNSISNSVGSLKLFANGAYTNGNELLPLRGGFVFANEAVNNLKFSFPGQVAGGRTRLPVFEGGDWLLPIKLVHDLAENDLGGIGMHRESELSFDGLDDLTPPAFGNTLELRFEHPEHFMYYFSRDVVPTRAEHEWRFSIKTDLAGMATLAWDASAISVSGQLFLYDEEAQIPIDMLSQSRYSFDLSSGRKFRVLTGSNVLEKLKPARITAGAPFPNPVVTVATIPFAIPEQSRGARYNVSLDVFDIVGRKIETLVNQELAPGFYQGTWSVHESVQEGIYFYRLSVTGGGTQEVIGGKMVLRNR